jgi:hypothetical protein
MFLKLTVAAGLILLTLLTMLRVQRYLKGEAGSLFERTPKRKETAHSPSDLEQFIESYRREKAGATGASAGPPAKVPATGSPSIRIGELSEDAGRRPFLTGANKLVYLVLKSGLPDHHIFANCRLADVVQTALPGWTEARAEFVVCRNDFQVVAVLDVVSSGAAELAMRASAEPLTSAGIRYLQVRASALPKPAEVRALIYPG